MDSGEGLEERGRATACGRAPSGRYVEAPIGQSGPLAAWIIRAVRMRERETLRRRACPADGSGMSPRFLSLFLAALLPACGDAGAAAEGDQATSVFTAFQRALQTGDAAATGRLLTTESQPVLAEMPWGQVRSKLALVPLGVERHDYEFWIRVRDPNDGGAESVFVVAREQGRLLVDLVATAGHHVKWGRTNTQLQFDDRALTPPELEMIRARAEAAQR